jgi:hypothetical protein
MQSALFGICEKDEELWLLVVACWKICLIQTELKDEFGEALLSML